MAMKFKKIFFYFFFQKTCFSREILPRIAFKTLTGSFSTYGNEMQEKYFLLFFFKKHVSLEKFCPQSLLKHSLDHFQPMAMKFKKNIFYFFFSKKHVSLQKFTIAFKTLTGSFSTCSGNGIKEKCFYLMFMCDVYV